MRIVFINRLLGVRFGGGEQVDASYARVLSSRGHDVTVIAGQRLVGRPQVELDLPNGRVVFLRTPYLRHLHYHARQKPSSQVRRLAGKLLGQHLDLALFQWAVRRWISLHGTRADWFQVSGLPQLAAWIERMQLGRAAVSWHGPVSTDQDLPHLFKYSLNWGPGTAYEGLRAVDPSAANIPNGVDTDLYHPVSELIKFASRDRLSIPLADTVYLYVGRLVPIKNLPLLLDAFSRLCQKQTNCRLLIVGDGESRSSLEAAARSLPLSPERIVFLGARFRHELVECYRAADVFCLPSIDESFSLATLEAMASSLPVIATRVGFLPALIDDQRTGLLVEPNSPAGMAAAMARLACDHPLRDRMGKSAMQFVKSKYPLETSVNSLLSAYDAAN